jgi:hypothetical protein
MSELTPGGVVVQRGCRALVLAGMPGFVRLFVWFLQWNRGSPFISKKKEKGMEVLLKKVRYQDASLLHWQKQKDMLGAKVQPHLIHGQTARCEKNLSWEITLDCRLSVSFLQFACSAVDCPAR